MTERGLALAGLLWASLACHGAAPGGVSAEQCAAIHQQIVTDMIAIGNRHRAGCTQDTDCELRPSVLSCQAACPMPIVRSDEAAFDGELAALDQQVCPTAPTNCAIEFDCGSYSPACDGGQCVSAP